MPSMATTLQNNLLNLVLRGVAYTPPAGLWLALFTSTVSASSLGTEVTGGSYSRRQVTFGTAAANGVITNTADIAITAMPATTVVSIALMTASSGGTHLFYGALTPVKQTNAGDTFTVRTGDLNIALV